MAEVPVVDWSRGTREAVCEFPPVAVHLEAGLDVRIGVAVGERDCPFVAYPLLAQPNLELVFFVRLELPVPERLSAAVGSDEHILVDRVSTRRDVDAHACLAWLDHVRRHWSFMRLQGIAHSGLVASPIPSGSVVLVAHVPDAGVDKPHVEVGELLFHDDVVERRKLWRAWREVDPLLLLGRWSDGALDGIVRDARGGACLPRERHTAVAGDGRKPHRRLRLIFCGGSGRLCRVQSESARVVFPGGVRDFQLERKVFRLDRGLA